MQRPPRDPEKPLFSRASIARSVIEGIGSLVVCVGVFLFVRDEHVPEAARALTFATLVVSIIALILVHRSRTLSSFAMLRVPNVAFRWVVSGALVLLGVVLFFPPAREAFHFAPLHPTDVVLSLVAGVSCVLWYELTKRFRRHRV
jgi:Ca2+-transporting ATPase